MNRFVLLVNESVKGGGHRVRVVVPRAVETDLTREQVEAAMKACYDAQTPRDYRVSSDADAAAVLYSEGEGPVYASDFPPNILNYVGTGGLSFPGGGAVVGASEMQSARTAGGVTRYFYDPPAVLTADEFFESSRPAG